MSWTTQLSNEDVGLETEENSNKTKIDDNDQGKSYAEFEISDSPECLSFTDMLGLKLWQRSL